MNNASNETEQTQIKESIKSNKSANRKLVKESIDDEKVNKRLDDIDADKDEKLDKLDKEKDSVEADADDKNETIKESCQFRDITNKEWFGLQGALGFIDKSLPKICDVDDNIQVIVSRFDGMEDDEIGIQVIYIDDSYELDYGLDIDNTFDDYDIYKDYALLQGKSIAKKLEGADTREEVKEILEANNFFKIFEETIDESCKSKKEFTKENKFALNKIRFTEDVDSFQPEDNIMVVYNPELSDDMTEEEVEQAAEDLIGCDICKCGVCGANYIKCEDDTISAEDVVTVDETDFDEEIEESIVFKGLNLIKESDEDIAEVSDDENIEDEEDKHCDSCCPICGAEDNQMVIGTIAPLDAEALDVDEDKIEAEVKEEDSESEEVADEVTVNIDAKDDAEVNVNTDSEKVVEEPVDENIEEGKRGPQKGATYNKEDEISDSKFAIYGDGELICKVPTRDEANKTVAALKREDRKLKTEVAYNIVELEPETHEVDKKANTPKKDWFADDDEAEGFGIDERVLNKLFTKFARENYENVANVRFNKATLSDNTLTFEGFVRTTEGNKKPIKLVSENFKLSRKTNIIKLSEKGPFTESANIASNKVPFVIGCNISKNKMTFNSLKYNYNVNEGKEQFKVCGKLDLKESK